jgi:hypothetical protein
MTERELLTADAFMAQVDALVRDGTSRRGLGGIEPQAPGFWLRGKAYAHLVPQSECELHLFLHRLQSTEAKVVQYVDATADDAHGVADRIVLHLVIEG